ncbi:MAG: hypothetical protein ACD_5C00351G0003 [uncultured bacterium]|nr:MAG: hypothetical protein ACD_5C00351G0003 [uncultured bacterium]
MIKTFRKIISGFSLISLLIVMGGFCYVPVGQASMNGMHQAAFIEDDCYQQNNYTLSQKSTPLSENSVRPCCVDRHDKVPTTPASNFSGIVEISLTQDQVLSSEKDVLTQKVSYISSDASPPKPDKLSSILRLE